MKNREERVLHGEVKPEVAKITVEMEQVEEEPEVFYDRVRATKTYIIILCTVNCCQYIAHTCTYTVYDG